MQIIDSPEAPTLAMAEPPSKTRKTDPLIALAVLFFLLAVAFAAAPLLNRGPETLAGSLLLFGLAGVCCLGLFVLRGAAEEPVETEVGAETFLAALDEPAAVVAPDGRLLTTNPAWREAMGAAPRLPKSGAAASSLFGALAAARRGELGRAALKTGGQERDALVSPIGPRRFLVRLTGRGNGPLALPSSAMEVLNAVASAKAPPPKVLDAFAAASPFGAALLEGEDPFEAKIIEANHALAQLAPGGEAGQVFGRLIEPASRLDAGLRLDQVRDGHTPLEVRLAHDPTRIAHLYLSQSGGRWVAYLVDVSDQKQVELQLAQSQKMQAIGQLAGGVAHDFNNLLTAILMQLDVLATRHPVGDPSYEGLNEIKQTSMRAADLVRKLLAFSRKQTVQREILDVGEMISESEVLLRRLLYEDIKLVTDYGRNLPHVRADRGQLDTAIMNLVVNARDAIRSHASGSGGGGTIRIRTARVTQDEARGLGYPTAVGDQAMVEVSDDGPGIPPEVMDKIFDPFFTTKPVGEGTGLGLATVYGIVKQSDGWIAVASKPGEGAAFRIFLPVHVAPVSAAPAPEPVAPKRPAARDLSGAGRILFVEDEDAVRGVAAKLLRARGYEVIEAASGEEALEYAETHAGEIDLMISDVVMPGMQGPDLLKQARQYLGAAPVMFISGYAESEFSDLLEGERNVSFLPKPIDIKTLAERVKQELQKAA
jgi:two-component system cell cycle sensor histidine kinase/response regulator CckA